MSRLRRVRFLLGAAILGLLAWRLGAGPFLAGLRSLSVGVVLIALAITLGTTVAAAWR